MNSILGPEETEDEWFKEGCGCGEDGEDGDTECAECDVPVGRAGRRRNTVNVDSADNGATVDAETTRIRPCSRKSSLSALALTCVPVAATATTVEVEPLSTSVAQQPTPSASSSSSSLASVTSPMATTTTTAASHPIMISRPTTPSAALRVQRRQAGRLILKKEKEREQTLVSGGDICGGRGGELGRRLEEVVRRRGLVTGAEHDHRGPDRSYYY